MNAAQHLNWGAEALWRQLEPLLPGLSVEVVARVDSTNTRLLERARASGGVREGRVTRPGDLDRRAGGEPASHGRRQVDVQPCLLVAEHQTQGRGRLGREWVGNAGASLTFSLALPLAVAEWSGLSLAVGMALADAFEPPHAAALPRIVLKWPNDLWLRDAAERGRKLGGILIETVNVGQHRMCVVGVGVNVLPQAIEGLNNGYACLQEIDPDISAPAALAQACEPLVRALLQFERDGFAAFAADYARRDFLRGQTVTTTLPALPEGVAEGVDKRGALRVRCGAAVHEIVSGEVSIRLRGSGST
jgi:BirA family transcriptional regulator, biotin operon repressor / biotin---[acetyl-CoA-carboxylase] ligase